MRVEVDGRRLYVDVEGTSLRRTADGLRSVPTLILVHGSPGSSDHTVFKPLFGQLADVAQIVYLDLLGCGRSDDAPEDVPQLERWADDIVGVCEALGVERPVVLGHSAGGNVAALYAMRHPDHPAGVILSCTQLRLSVDRCLDMFARLGGEEARTVARTALVDDGGLTSWAEFGKVCMPLYNPTPRPVNRDATFRQACFERYHRLGGTWHSMDLLDQLGEVRCPTLVLAGVDDPVTPAADSDDIVARLDPSIVQYERVANAGHGTWIDHPEWTFDRIRTFVTSL